MAGYYDLLIEWMLDILSYVHIHTLEAEQLGKAEGGIGKAVEQQQGDDDEDNINEGERNVEARFAWGEQEDNKG